MNVINLWPSALDLNLDFGLFSVGLASFRFDCIAGQWFAPLSVSPYSCCFSPEARLCDFSCQEQGTLSAGSKGPRLKWSSEKLSFGTCPIPGPPKNISARVLFCFAFASDIIILIIAWCWNNSLPPDHVPYCLSICSISQRRVVQYPESWILGPLSKCPSVRDPDYTYICAAEWGDRHATWTCTLQDNHIKKRASPNPHPSVQSGNRWQIRALVSVAMHHPCEAGMPNWHLYQRAPFVL